MEVTAPSLKWLLLTTAGDLGNDCIRLQRLRDDPCLVIHRPLTPSWLPLRVKGGQVQTQPISDPNAEPATSQIDSTPEGWSGSISYD